MVCVYNSHHHCSWPATGPNPFLIVSVLWVWNFLVQGLEMELKVFIFLWKTCVNPV